MSELQNPAKLKLNDLRVVFYTKEDDEKVVKENYKPNFTVALSDEQAKEVEEFVKVNEVGKNGDPNKGVANIKEYTHPETGVKTKQFAFKFNEKTQWAGINGLGKENMGPGARVNIIVNAYPYRKFTGGVAMSASAVVLTKGTAAANAEEDLAELMAEVGGNDIDAGDVPF